MCPDVQQITVHLMGFLRQIGSNFLALAVQKSGHKSVFKFVG